jgi:phosphoglucomutase
MNILETVKLWAENPYFDTETRKEAKILLAEDKQTEREECFGSLLEFGTGGLRGIMGVGTNRINRYTIQTATEGVARIIKKKAQESDATGVVIGYDSRHRSFEFAQVSSQVLAAHGIPVFLFREIAPTPLVSCELLRRKAIAGIIITASHNPPEYNGYKVYWENGGLIMIPAIAFRRKSSHETSGVGAISRNKKTGIPCAASTWLLTCANSNDR